MPTFFVYTSSLLHIIAEKYTIVFMGHRLLIKSQVMDTWFEFKAIIRNKLL